MLKLDSTLQILELHRPLLKGKKSNWINDGLIRVKNHGKMCWIKSKNLQFLRDDGSEDKKAKGTKTCAIKRKLKLKTIKAVQNQLNLIIN